jgi:hypothetical protein
MMREKRADVQRSESGDIVEIVGTGLVKKEESVIITIVGAALPEETRRRVTCWLEQNETVLRAFPRPEPEPSGQPLLCAARYSLPCTVGCLEQSLLPSCQCILLTLSMQFRINSSHFHRIFIFSVVSLQKSRSESSSLVFRSRG